MHESLVESPINSPKLNHEGDAGMFVLSFDLSFLLSLEDFDANVYALTFDFLNVCSHEVALTFDHIDHSNSMNLLFLDLTLLRGLNVNLMLRSHYQSLAFWILIKKKMENVN